MNVKFIISFVFFTFIHSSIYAMNQNVNIDLYKTTINDRYIFDYTIKEAVSVFGRPDKTLNLTNNPNQFVYLYYIQGSSHKSVHERWSR